MIDSKKLALIHIVKKELGLADADYRSILQKVCGVSSAKDLDDRLFRRLMGYFARSNYYRINNQGLTFRQKMYIKGLKEQAGWDERHFSNFLKKYYEKDKVDLLSKQEASNVINALKNITKHRKNPQLPE